MAVYWYKSHSRFQEKYDTDQGLTPLVHGPISCASPFYQVAELGSFPANLGLSLKFREPSG